MDRIGFNVKRYRLSKRISRKYFCAMCDISQSYLSDLERGKKNNITTCILIRFCKVLDVTPNDLIPEDLYKGDNNDEREFTGSNDS